MADASLLLSLPDTVLTDTTLPFASVTVVVTEPSALVVTLVVSLDDEALPPDDDAPEAEAEAGAVLGDALADAVIERIATADVTELMLPLMMECSGC